MKLAGNCEEHPSEPGEWQIRSSDQGPYFVFACPLGQPHACSAPIAPSPPNSRGCVWTWDGNIGKPTISPSFNCNLAGACGFHKTLIAGEWR